MIKKTPARHKGRPRKDDEGNTDDLVVKLTVTLRAGAEFEVAGGLAEAIHFHKRFKKFVDGQIHRTDNHRLLQFGGTYFYAETLAAYSAEDASGNKVNLGGLV